MTAAYQETSNQEPNALRAAIIDRLQGLNHDELIAFNLMLDKVCAEYEADKAAATAD